MRLSKFLLAAAVLAVACGGCISWSAPVQPPRGLLVTVYRAPMGTDFERTPVGGKTGTASSLYFAVPITGLPLSFAWDDASIQAAAQQGGISQVHYADYEITEVLGIFGRFTTIVHGQ